MAAKEEVKATIINNTKGLRHIRLSSGHDTIKLIPTKPTEVDAGQLAAIRANKTCKAWIDAGLITIA